jgi:hypothetical protein
LHSVLYKKKLTGYIQYYKKNGGTDTKPMGKTEPQFLSNGCMKDVMSLANIYTNNQSCRDRLHKWVWLKPEMYKRGENNENYVI